MELKEIPDVFTLVNGIDDGGSPVNAQRYVV